MKGVSAIIAIILILMIVIALASLAYTWFSGIFSSLTNTASNATTTATTAMGMQVIIEAAKYYANDNVTVTLRNTGTVDVDPQRISGYVDGNLGVIGGYSSTAKVSPGGTVTFNISNTTAACSGKNVKTTLETGFEEYHSITC